MQRLLRIVCQHRTEGVLLLWTRLVDDWVRSSRVGSLAWAWQIDD